jgi:hypothetical protein
MTLPGQASTASFHPVISRLGEWPTQTEGGDRRSPACTNCDGSVLIWFGLVWFDRTDQPEGLSEAIGIVPAPPRGLSLRLSICFR